jgi:hypothetical protein
MMHHPARDVEQPLRMGGQQGDEQRRASRVQVGCPTHLITVGKINHGTDQLEELGLVVVDPTRQQHHPDLVDHHAVVRPLPRVNSRPHCRHPSSFRILVIGHNPVDSYAGTSLPNDRCRKSQSAVELSVGRRAAIPSEPSKQRGDLSHTRHPRDTGNLRHARLTTPQQRKEGDLIIGRKNLSAIGTLVERTTNYTMLLHLPDGYTPELVRDALAAKIKTLPEVLRASLTWDQGPEMGKWNQVAVDADIDIFFCDPHAPWQRATNESTVSLVAAAAIFP